MSNIFDYLKWRGDLTFAQDSPNGVDALIFSGLSYIRFPYGAEQGPVLLQKAAEAFFDQENYEECCRIQKDIQHYRRIYQGSETCIHSKH